MRVVVSGGGTGGHIFPALALCEQLKILDPSGELLYIGGSTGMESEIVPQKAIPYQAVSALKLKKLISFSTIGVLHSLIKGYKEARVHLREFKADVVVGTGGYVAAAATMAGVSLKLPTLIVAPDMVPGRTNSVLGRFAKRICVCFPQTIKRFPRSKTVVTGMPLRSGTVASDSLSQANAREYFNLSPDRFTILVIGGSQGARAINDMILASLNDLISADSQIIHQTGKNNFEEVSSKAEAMNLSKASSYYPVAFLDEAQIPMAMRSADIIVCRGGISTLSEATANGLPALIIPLPTAYADHQTANAAALQELGAAMLCPEKSLSGPTLTVNLLRLRNDRERLARMASASRKVGRPEAADEVARLILEIGKK